MTEKFYAPGVKGAEIAKRKIAEAAARKAAAAPARPGQAPDQVRGKSLPLWPEAVRGVPNGVLRSALFGAIKKGPRRYMQGEQVAALEGIEIRYTGQQLDQGDLDVWESLLHVARVQEMGERCRFTAYSLMKLMGKTDTGKNRETLQTRIERLRANAVNIKQGRYSYIGGLVDEAFKDDETQEWVIGLNPKLHDLFAADQFTQVEWSVRRALDGQPLAQWLHGFYACHAKPYPIKIETLHKLCGSEATLMSDFAKTLRKALDAVAEASAAHGEGFMYDIRGDLVYIEKTASGPQRRHLAKASKPRKPRI